MKVVFGEEEGKKGKRKLKINLVNNGTPACLSQ